MYNPKKFSTMGLTPSKAQGDEHLATVAASGGPSGGNSVPAGGNGKQRLRWTSDLHDRFVDAIAQLGGPDSGFLIFSLELYSSCFTTVSVVGFASCHTIKE